MLDTDPAQTYLPACASCGRSVAKGRFTTDERTMGSTNSGNAAPASPTKLRLAAPAKPAWALMVALR